MTSAAATDAPITYADFVPGTALGSHTEVFEPRMAHAWREIFGTQPQDGAGGPAESASIAMAMSMRAFLSVVQPRPPGNVHARERFVLHASPRIGERVHTVVTCTGKELRRERRYVDLQVHASGDAGRPLYTGQMSLIWAA